MITENDMQELRELVSQLATQDNFGTADPVYQVQRRVWRTVPDSCGERTAYFDDEGSEYSEEEYLERTREAGLFDSDMWEVSTGIREVSVAEDWETVDTYLTYESAQDRIPEGSTEWRVYIDSAHRNHEIRLLRRILPELLAVAENK